MFSELVGEIGVCTDCLFAREGDGTPDRPADLPEEWSEIPFGYVVTAGGEHADECPNRDSVTRDTDCDCDELGFCQSSCDGCGDHHHGDRFRYTLWRATDAEALNRFADAIKRYRSSVGNAQRFTHLTEAAQWRSYLADRFAERRRFERWSAARGIAA